MDQGGTIVGQPNSVKCLLCKVGPHRLGPGLISIETVKLPSSQHRFYFDVHKVCGKLGRVKTALDGW